MKFALVLLFALNTFITNGTDKPPTPVKPQNYPTCAAKYEALAKKHRIVDPIKILFEVITPIYGWETMYLEYEARKQIHDSVGMMAHGGSSYINRPGDRGIYPATNYQRVADLLKAASAVVAGNASTEMIAILVSFYNDVYRRGIPFTVMDHLDVAVVLDAINNKAPALGLCRNLYSREHLMFHFFGGGPGPKAEDTLKLSRDDIMQKATELREGKQPPASNSSQKSDVAKT